VSIIDLGKIIKSIRNKRDAKSLVHQFASGQRDIDDLMTLFFSDDWVMCQKASWPVTMVADENPDLLLPYIERMLTHLDKPQHDAYIRNTIRTWQEMKIPEEYEGPIYDKCFEYFADPQYAVAIRVFSMTVCTDIAMRHPTLAHEIIPIIEDYWDHGTAAWRSRGKKELKRLHELVDERVS